MPRTRPAAGQAGSCWLRAAARLHAGAGTGPGVEVIRQPHACPAPFLNRGWYAAGMATNGDLDALPFLREVHWQRVRAYLETSSSACRRAHPPTGATQGLSRRVAAGRQGGQRLTAHRRPALRPPSAPSISIPPVAIRPAIANDRLQGAPDLLFRPGRIRPARRPGPSPRRMVTSAATRALIWKPDAGREARAGRSDERRLHRLLWRPPSDLPPEAAQISCIAARADRG